VPGIGERTARAVLAALRGEEDAGAVPRPDGDAAT
jgi:hypothetical protein